MVYGVTITGKGHNYLAKLIAGDTLNVTRVMVGSGKVPDNIDPADLDELIQMVTPAAMTQPIQVNSTVEFIVEYRNDMNVNLQDRFWLNEYAVFVLDPEQGEIMLYYGNLGDYPENVDPFHMGRVVVRRYPVTIALSKDLNLTINYPTGVFVTYEEFAATQPTVSVATIHHGLDIMPTKALYAGDFAYGIAGYGDGPYGGEILLEDVPVKLIPINRNIIRVYVPPQYAGYSQVNRLSKHEFALFKNGSNKTLTLIMR